MALIPKAASALRAQTALLLVPTLALTSLGLAGCSHRRASMRPIYMGSPAAVAPPCNTPGGCDESVAVPSSTVTVPSRVIETPVLEPAEIGPANALPDSPPSTSQKARSEPGLDRDFTPSSGSRSDEPALKDTKGNGGGKALDLEPADDLQPELVPPNASRGTVRRRTATAKQRRTSVVEAVRYYANDPGDLFAPPKADRPWKYVVLHHSAHDEGGLDQIDREHRKSLGFDGCGYHFVIGNGTGSPDGQIEVARRWSNQKGGVHTRNAQDNEMNEDGIGICLVGDLDNKPPTPKQVAAARALVAYLSEHYRIPASRIGTHADLVNSPSACPGKHFPSQDIFGVRGVASR